ncbi:septal ring lytic transglycosylase RlpA family protein [Marinospirillum sp. MEB164]|uniref:Endolytic peptidoglycan transglycosylase RlpA n=1 Tax=Marinospirillum alkalitolerans TaxID=3123374 RepID=A0ABW8PZM6_9GAMM
MKRGDVALRLVALAGIALLTGCSVGGGGGVFGAHSPSGQSVYTLQDRVTSSGGGRYTQRVDGLPANPPDVSRIPDAIPRVEPRSRQGNAAQYTVFGETYRVLPSSQGFVQTGIASWYGTKFHGHLTSNGEVYDMYAMTAAHTTLPIPTYVRVTNLDNQRQVIVRINDRGPFVGRRIIDLSYAAAYRLGIVQTGTGRVRVEAIDPLAWQRENPTQVAAQSSVFLQVAALADAEAATRLQERVRGMTQAPVRILSSQGSPRLYRVQVGPLAEGEPVQAAIRQLEASDLGRPLLVRQ